jgi:taurine dioxygenase
VKYKELKLMRRSPYLGEFVEGIDLCGELRTNTLAEIKSALLEFSVLFSRNQPIDQDQQLRLAAQFGTIEEPHTISD